MATRRANLRAGVETINFDKCSTVPPRLVFKLTDELGPTRIGNRLTKIQGFLHASYVQILGNDYIKLPDESGTHIMSEVLALIGNLLMNFSNFDALLVVSVGTF